MVHRFKLRRREKVAGMTKEKQRFRWTVGFLPPRKFWLHRQWAGCILPMASVRREIEGEGRGFGVRRSW